MPKRGIWYVFKRWLCIRDSVGMFRDLIKTEPTLVIAALKRNLVPEYTIVSSYIDNGNIIMKTLAGRSFKWQMPRKYDNRICLINGLCSLTYQFYGFVTEWNAFVIEQTLKWRFSKNDIKRLF